MIINGIFRKKGYYVSDIIIHNRIGRLCIIELKVYKNSQQNSKRDGSRGRKKVSTKEILQIGKRIKQILRVCIQDELKINLKIRLIDNKTMLRDARIMGDYIGDELMARPHAHKQIMFKEFKRAESSR